MRTTSLLLAITLAVPLYAADTPQDPAPKLGQSSPAIAATAATRDAVSADFDCPRVAKDQTRPVRAKNRKLRTNQPCGGCLCFSECENSSDPDECIGGQAFGNCTYFGSVPPCACGPCVCF